MPDQVRHDKKTIRVNPRQVGPEGSPIDRDTRDPEVSGLRCAQFRKAQDFASLNSVDPCLKTKLVPAKAGNGQFELTTCQAKEPIIPLVHAGPGFS
jgi:hypothetical protein